MSSSPSGERPLGGQVALVAGAASGIGRATALELGRAGACLVCADVDGAGAEAVAAAVAATGGGAIGRRSDVTRAGDAAADVAAAVRAFGGLDVLVYAAATREPSGTVLEITEEDWARTLAVNLTGAFLVSRAALPAMIARGGGRIVLIASQLGRVATEGRPAYCASKGALIQLARAMATDHARDRIRVNTLSPGAVETGRLAHRYGDLETARATLAPRHLLGRLGTPEEIARAVLFLASDASSFVTGADLLADGGYTAV